MDCSVVTIAKRKRMRVFITLSLIRRVFPRQGSYNFRYNEPIIKGNTLHFFRNLNAQQMHTSFYGSGNGLRHGDAHLESRRIGFSEDGNTLIKLIVFLREFVDEV